MLFGSIATSTTAAHAGPLHCTAAPTGGGGTRTCTGATVAVGGTGAQSKGRGSSGVVTLRVCTQKERKEVRMTCNPAATSGRLRVPRDELWRQQSSTALLLRRVLCLSECPLAVLSHPQLVGLLAESEAASAAARRERGNKQTRQGIRTHANGLASSSTDCRWYSRINSERHMRRNMGRFACTHGMVWVRQSGLTMPVAVSSPRGGWMGSL